MIEIKHNRESGTLILGTRKGDGSAAVIKAAGGFRPSRSLPNGAYWYIPHSRDRRADRYVIGRCAEALRGANFEVSVEIDDLTQPTTTVAEREEERKGRAEDRAERFGEYADHAAERGRARVDAVRRARDVIPLGQPLLVGHYSYRRDLAAASGGIARRIGDTRSCSAAPTGLTGSAPPRALRRGARICRRRCADSSDWRPTSAACCATWMAA